MRKLKEIENEFATRLGKCCETSFELVLLHQNVEDNWPSGPKKDEAIARIADVVNELQSQEAFLTLLLNDVKWARSHYGHEIAGF